MTRARNVAVVVGSVWVAGLAAKLLAHDVVGLDGWPLAVILGVASLAGLAMGTGEVRGLGPMTSGERRNAILGWGFVISLVAVGAALLIPMPWAVPAALATAVACWVAVTAAAGRTRAP